MVSSPLNQRTRLQSLAEGSFEDQLNQLADERKALDQEFREVRKELRPGVWLNYIISENKGKIIV